MSRLKIAFLVSGNGTLFEALAAKCRSGELEADPVLVISSRADAPAIERARKLEIPAVVIPRKSFATDDEFAKALLKEFQTYRADFIILAGYLQRIPSALVREYFGKMINIHPALLPAFGGKGMYGRKVHEAVIESGARLSGATVHLVDDEYDHGPILLQRAVFVKSKDNAEDLEKRVHAIEFDLYREAVQLFTQDRVKLNGRRAEILPPPKKND